MTDNLCEEADRRNSNRWTLETWTLGDQVINIRQREERKGRDSRRRERLKVGGEKGRVECGGD